VAVIRPSFPEDNFTRVPNAWLRDPKLDPAPKAYLCYLLSHAAGFRCSTSQAARDLGVNRSTVSAWNAKLVERGYFVAVEQSTGSGGRFGENDYRVTSCVDSAPPLPENRAVSTGEPARSTDTVKPRTVEPTRSNRARSTQRIEEQGEKNTPVPTEQGADEERRHLRAVDGDDEEARLREKLAQSLAAEHYEATGKLGGSRSFLALRGIVARALEVGHAEQQIRAALAHLRQRGRPVTNATLGPLLADPRTVTSGPYGPRQHIPTDPDAHRGAF
jgi:hypothetical protein